MTMTRRIAFGFLWIVTALGSTAAADVKLPALLSDHMVLQQNTNARIWGWARPGESISVRGSWSESAVDVKVNERGEWQAFLPTPEAGGPHQVTVQGDTTIVLQDVLVGEVWVASGQSNMEWAVSNSDGAKQVIADAAQSPRVRFFQVPNEFAVHPRLDVSARWQQSTSKTVPRFSAVAYAYARALESKLGVPVGVIQSDWGGTVAEAWMSPQALKSFPEFEERLAFLDRVGDPNTRGDSLKGNQGRWWDLLDGASGIPAGWKDADFDAKGWGSQTLPSSLSGPLANFDGLVYYRRVIELSEAAAKGDAQLELGPIDDMDDAWVNGVHVGSEHADGRWGKVRKYAIPAGVLRAGKNVIAVRMLDNAGLGGINGKPEQMRIVRGDTMLAPLAGEWSEKRGAARSKLSAATGQTGLHQNVPTLLYQAMIAPIQAYTIQGFIWYQGESNRSRPEQYRRLFRELIRDWRAQWRLGDLPFYFVQIAPYAYGGDDGEAALLREAQRHALEEPNTGMVVTTDIGNPKDIHPRDKQTVGERLALWASRGTYGDATSVASGPRYRHMRIEGNEIRLHFDHAEGMELRESDRSYFTISGSNRRFVAAEARIDGHSIVVSSAQVDRPLAVRFGWEAAAEPNLFGSTGLPASPFRTDGWSGPPPPAENEKEMRSHRTQESGFRPIFNGEDLSGWAQVNCAPSTWTVQDNRIVCSGFPTGVLRTDRMYENFVLELEYRHLKAGGNAGLFIWSDPLTARGQPFTRSVEVQVMDGLEGTWYTSDGDIFPIHGATLTPENGRGGQRAFPTEARTNPSPLWNHYRVTCLNGEVSLAVNGKVVTRGREASPRKGYICLEAEGSLVHFRNLRLKELPSSESLDPKHVAREAEDFRPLYNGVDLSGWKASDAHRVHWKVADWILDFDGTGPDLWTEESFEDFVLICDWRWKDKGIKNERPVILPTGLNAVDADGKPTVQVVQDAGDSGIYLRGNSKSQVNIWCWPIGSGEVYGYRTDGTQPAEVRAGVTPKMVADAPIGRWNRFVITMRGDRLTVDLNGKTVISEAQLPGVPATGPIGLQRHGSPIQFGNIFIRELPPIER